MDALTRCSSVLIRPISIALVAAAACGGAGSPSAPATHAISGTVAGAGGAAVSLTLGGASSATVTTDSSGRYAFGGLADGTYTVTPSLPGSTCTPLNRSITVNGADVGGQDFTAQADTYGVSGQVSGATAAGVTLTLSGAGSASVTTDSSGTYRFSGIANGSYTLTPSKAGYVFYPSRVVVNVNGAEVTGQNFSASLATVGTYAVSGTVTGATVSGVTVSLTDAAKPSTVTDATGSYRFAGLANGSYKVTPSMPGYTFSPPSSIVTVDGASVTEVDFAAAPAPANTHAVSGTVTGVTAAGVTLSLSGASMEAAASTDVGGYYTFGSVPDGSYTLTASKAGYTFSPATVDVSVSAGNVTVQDITADFSSILYDALTGAALDGAKYSSAQISRKVQGGALALQVTSSNLESATVRGVRPACAVSVSGSGTTRVTTWQATIAVPSSSATRTGTATIQAAIALSYQPAVDRLAFPVGAAKLAVASLGLEDTGAGLQFFRRVSLCADPSCAATDAATNIVYTDGSGGTALPQGQPASYATAYTFTLSLNESTNVFTYTISGGDLGTVRSGTADASALFSAQGIAPASDFLDAQLRVRAYDEDPAGGSAGTMLATFDGVYRGTAGAAAALYDDFSGSTIDPTRWKTGEGSVAMSGGALELSASVTSPTGGQASSSAALTPDSIPTAANQLKMDVTIVADSPAAGAGSDNRFMVARSFYNDGSATAPDINQPGSMVGDVGGRVFLTTTSAYFQVYRCVDAASGSYIALSSSTNDVLNPSPTHPLGIGTTHTVMMGWDPTSHKISFQLDEAPPVVVDPTTTSDPHMSIAAPYVRAKRVDYNYVIATAYVAPGSPSNASGSITIRLGNIYY